MNVLAANLRTKNIDSLQTILNQTLSKLKRPKLKPQLAPLIKAQKLYEQQKSLNISNEPNSPQKVKQELVICEKEKKIEKAFEEEEVEDVELDLDDLT